MKNINYIINGVLAVAIVILFVLQFSGKKEQTVTPTFVSEEGAPASVLPIAYVNVDSLLSGYNYAQDLYEIQMRSQESARANINQKARDLEKNMTEFRRKVENNAFLSTDRAEQEQQRIIKMREDLQALDEKTAYDLSIEQQRMSMILRDTIISQLKVYNQTKGYQMIFSNTGGDNIWLADDAYDITGELIEVLNKNYSQK